MKILYYTREGSSNMSMWQRLHFFDELAKHGIEIVTLSGQLLRSWEEANALVIKLLKSGEYSLFFTAICRKEQLFIETLQEIKRIGIPSLCIRFDNLLIPYFDKDLSPYFDLVWLTSIETKLLYDKWGVKSLFQPYAANPFFFKYTEKPLKRQVCFIGTPYGSRTRMMNVLTTGEVNLSLFFGKPSNESKPNDIIKEVEKLPAVQYGKMNLLIDRMKTWEGRRLIKGTMINKIKGNIQLLENNYLSKSPSVPFDQICEIYSEYVLALASTSAVHTDILKEPLKVINLRNFEIPMSGGIEICRYNKELSEYFEEDKEIIFYNNNDELVDKAKFYTQKATDTDINAIKCAARKRAENEHTWFNRFSKVFEELGLKSL